MVQKKVPNKLGIQADHTKSHNLVVNLKPSSLQHQESKNRGPDKKSMKRYRKNLNSSGFRKQVPPPGKPPPPIFPTMAAAAAASPQMQSPTKTSDKTPNYMKSTSSSDARREKSQVNFKNLQTTKKNGKSPAKSSSLKLVRTLTKTTSFKPSRAGSKKCHPFVPSEKLDAQRATCSSTLKDSKFPDFLELSSGGTEAEGTSAIKVCPYTYCSLNGHRLPPLPPLKSFLSARRLMLKTQRSIKLGCLSPRRSRPKRDVLEEKKVQQVNCEEKFVNEEPQESLWMSPVMDNDFFIQIYSKEMEGGNRDERLEELESPLSEIDYQEIYYGKGDTITSEADAAGCSPEQNQNECVKGMFFGPKTTTVEPLSRQDIEVESTRSTMSDIQAFSLLDSESEAEGYPTLCLDDQVVGGDSSKYDKTITPEEYITKPDVTESSSFEEMNLGNHNGESFERENMSSDADSDEEFSTDESMTDKAYEKPGKQRHDDIDELAAVEEWLRPLGGQKSHDIFPCDENFHAIEAVVDGSILPKKMDSETFKKAADLSTNEEHVHLSSPGYSESVEDHPSGDIRGGDQCLSSDQKHESCGVENLYDIEKNAPAITPSECTYSQGQLDTTVVENALADDIPASSQSTEISILADVEEERCPDAKSRRTLDAGDANEETKFDLDTGSWLWQKKKSILEEEELKGFNPRGPNFLPVEPGPEAEKVDLKHQMMDDRRNSEEWMLDYAIQQAVTKLAAARKKKVTLLVEAFETVLPIPKCETQLRQRSVRFDHGRRIQACS